jgi:fibronectin-binding autotransporter adhesin
VTLGGPSGSGQGGTLEYTGSSAVSNMPFTLGAGGFPGFQVDADATNLTLNGAIAGGGELTKLGPGTLTLGGNNVYGGGTLVVNGTLNTTASGALGPGPLTFGGLLNHPSIFAAVNIGNSQTVSSLSTENFNDVLLGIGSGATLTDDQSFGDTSFQGLLVNSGTFAKSGISLLEIVIAPTLNPNSALVINGGKLRFNCLPSGTAAIGAGVTAMVASGATLELAGAVSALANGTDRVNITNNSSPAGLLVSGTHQQVGNIDGSGATQINVGGDLTANHIIQSALVIGGTLGSHGLVTIDASDAFGNPLTAAPMDGLSEQNSAGLIVADSFIPSDPFAAGDNSLTALMSVAVNSSELAVPATGNSVGIGNPSSVPEPSTLLLALLAVLGVVSTQFVRHYFRCQPV